MTVEVNDPSLTLAPNNTASHQIDVVDVNEAPMVGLTIIQDQIDEDEDTSSRTKVATISILDDSLGTNDLTLSGDGKDNFEIVGNELFLKAGVSLDFELIETIAVTVEVNDSTLTPDPNDSAEFTLTVNDVNEAPSVFLDNEVTTILVATDMSASNYKVGDISVADDAMGTNALSLEGPDKDVFEIIGSELYLKQNTPLTVGTIFEVEVQVSDFALGSVSSTNLSLQVLAVNDAPTLSLSNTAVNLPENFDTSLPTELSTITIVDDGFGVNNLRVVGTDRESFEINGGKLYLKAGVDLDFESKPEYAIAVRVFDPALGLQPDDRIQFRLNVDDVNEAPSLSVTTFVDQIPENSDTTSPIKFAEVSVTDDALGTNEITITGEDKDHFELVGNEVFLNANTDLNFETKSEFDITIEVGDASLGTTTFVEQSLTLEVVDLNESPTLQLTTITDTLTETTDTSTRIKLADIVIVDDALGTNAITVENGDAADFELVGNELFLRADTSFDWDAKKFYDVEVHVRDASLGSDNFVAFRLNITDFNSPPTLDLSTNDLTLPENTDTSSRIEVATYTINGDSAGIDLIRIEGADKDFFEFDSSKIYLKANTDLDFESKSSYSFTVEVYDNSIGSTTVDSESFVLNVQNINEAPTTKTGTPFSQNEDSGTSTIELSDWFEDQDSYDTNLTYTLLSVADSWVTAQLDGETLSLTPDENANGITSVQVRATDMFGASTTQTIDLNFTPVNDTLQPANQVFEASAGEVVSGTLISTTTDVDGESLSIQVIQPPSGGSLQINPDGTFTFNPTDGFSGVLTFKYVVDDGVSLSNPVEIRIDYIAPPIEPETEIESEEENTETESSSEEENTETLDVIDPNSRDDDESVGELASYRPREVAEVESERAQANELESAGDRKFSFDSFTDAFADFTPVTNSNINEVTARTNDIVEQYMSLTNHRLMWNDLDEFHDQSSNPSEVNMVFGSVGTLSSGVLVGYVIWAIRGGTMLSSILASMPAWSLFDPMAVVSFAESSEDEDGESLEDIVETQKQKLKNPEKA